MAVAVAREMRLSETAVEAIQFAALLHDVGMIGKDHLLDHDQLNPEEIEDMKGHVRVGAEMARELPRRDVPELILRHHERFDGSGFPDGLARESIPLGARIIAVAEMVDSMAAGIFPSHSVVRADSIVAFLRGERGQAFDPDVVDAFLRALQKGTAVLSPSGS